MTDIPPAEAGTAFDDVPDPATLRRPVRPDAPAGDDLAADGTRQAVEVARGAVRTPADRGAVRTRCAEALTRGRDPWMAAWLAEALTHQHGFAGLRAGLEAFAAVVDAPGADPDTAAAAAAWLAETLPPVLDAVPEGGGDAAWYDALETDLTEAQAAVETARDRLTHAATTPPPAMKPLTDRLDRRLAGVRDHLVTATLGAARQATAEALDTAPPAPGDAAPETDPRARACRLLEEAAALLESNAPDHPAGPLARRAAHWAAEESGPLVARLLAEGAAASIFPER